MKPNNRKYCFIFLRFHSNQTEPTNFCKSFTLYFFCTCAGEKKEEKRKKEERNHVALLILFYMKETTH